MNGMEQSRSAGQAAAIILSAAAAISTPHISKGIAFVDDDENSLSDVSLHVYNANPERKMFLKSITLFLFRLSVQVKDLWKKEIAKC